MLYNISLFIAYLLYKMSFVREINGMENIPKEGCIIASNHVSYLDPPIIGFTLSKKLNRRIHYIAKIELFMPFFSRVVHEIFECIPVDREKKDISWIKLAEKYIKKGHMIGIFPEGGRSRSKKLQRGKTGAVRLAISAHAPIVPVGIKGTYDIWPSNKKFPKIKKIVRINIGNPIFFDKYYKRTVTKKLLRQLTNNLMKEIAKLSGQSH